MPLNLPPSTIATSLASLSTLTSTLESLTNSRRLPTTPLSNNQITLLLNTLSLMDSNNNVNNVGVGEREGRLFSSLVSSNNLLSGSAHGVGRSGDINASQPKAGGMSVAAILARCLVLDAIRRGAGLSDVAKHGVVLPVCTGMGVLITLMSLRGRIMDHLDEEEECAKNVILWARCDQKSVLKAIKTAGFKVVVLETVGRCGSGGGGGGDTSDSDSSADAVHTNISLIEDLIKLHGADKILAIVTTTSCFAPRVPDDVPVVAKLCHKNSIFHVINSAYGIQCRHTIKNLLKRAVNVCEKNSEYAVSAVVSSLDKNFMVPVGGCLVYGPNKQIVDGIGKSYPGRGQGAHVVNLLVTLLAMGMEGYKNLLDNRERMLETFVGGLSAVATKHGERLLRTGGNSISYAISLRSLDKERAGLLGSMLFKRCVSGTRVVVCGNEVEDGKEGEIGKKEVCGIEFVEYGSSCSDGRGYGCSYLTAACAIGMREEEIGVFLERLDLCLAEAKKKSNSIV